MNDSKRGSASTQRVSMQGVLDLKMVMSYVVATHKSMSVKKIAGLFAQILRPPGPKVIALLLPMLELERMRVVLLDQLKARFRRVPARIEARIQDADKAALKRWSARLSTAARCAEVLDDDAEAPGGARAGGAKKTRGARRRPASASKRV